MIHICVVCSKTYDQGRQMTCSDACQGELVRRFIAQFGFGEFKKVVRKTTGVAYKVPTRDIIERGIIREQELDQYPRWED